MAHEEPRSFLTDRLGPEERQLLRTAHDEGRVSASLIEDNPLRGHGLDRYARLEALCAKGLLAYDGDDGMDDELQLGFVITDAGRAFVVEGV
jgi:hypothetical protein